MRMWSRLALGSLFLAISCARIGSEGGDGGYGGGAQPAPVGKEAVVGEDERVVGAPRVPIYERLQVWKPRKMLEPHWEDIPGAYQIDPENCLFRSALRDLSDAPALEFIRQGISETVRLEAPFLGDLAFFSTTLVEGEERADLAIKYIEHGDDWIFMGLRGYRLDDGSLNGEVGIERPPSGTPVRCWLGAEVGSASEAFLVGPQSVGGEKPLIINGFWSEDNQWSWESPIEFPRDLELSCRRLLYRGSRVGYVYSCGGLFVRFVGESDVREIEQPLSVRAADTERDLLAWAGFHLDSWKSSLLGWTEKRGVFAMVEEMPGKVCALEVSPQQIAGVLFENDGMPGCSGGVEARFWAVARNGNEVVPGVSVGPVLGSGKVDVARIVTWGDHIAAWIYDREASQRSVVLAKISDWSMRRIPVDGSSMNIMPEWLALTSSHFYLGEYEQRTPYHVHALELVHRFDLRDFYQIGSSY